MYMSYIHTTSNQIDGNYNSNRVILIVITYILLIVIIV